MKKKAIVSLTNEKFKSISNLTFPLIKQYAWECDADFIPVESNGPVHNFMIKFDAYKEFHNYEQCLYIDADCVIKKNIPNIFENKKLNKFYAIDEYQYIKCENFYLDQNFQEIINNQKIETDLPKYSISAGVILVGKPNYDLFELPETIMNFRLFEQSLITIRSHVKNVFEPLDIKWNCVNWMGDLYQKNHESAYILHLNFMGEDKLDQINKCMKKFNLF